MESINTFYYRYLRYFLAKDDATATVYDKYMALSYALRSQMVDKWIETQKYYHENNVRRIYYVSMDYVLGKSLKQNIINLGLEENITQVSQNLGFSLDEIYEQEDDFELGNDRKGRMAACIQDSMATMGLPSMGYGLHYDYAHFRQEIQNGTQIEKPYDWLHKGHPWEIVRPQYICTVGFNGEVELVKDTSGRIKAIWKNREEIGAVPYDVPIAGYRNKTVNTIRLWSSRPSEEFSLDYLNHQDYVRACEEKSRYERITSVLFPDEEVLRATELRIKQQYFLISATLQDILRRFKEHNKNILDLDKKVIIQLNGSNCAIAIVELMRLLVDLEGIPWDDAWQIAKNVFAYTSHAVSRDNLENWPVYLIEQIIPRHIQIIYEINQRYLDSIRKKGEADSGLLAELSIVEEGEVKRIKMAHLAVLGSSYVNGVCQEQTTKLEKEIFGRLSKNIPAKFVNVTNGVAHRRWLLCANRPLASFLIETIGDKWISSPDGLAKLKEFIDDSEFKFRLGDIKHTAKRILADVFKSKLNLDVDSKSLFDIHCKKIHLYKRQMLHILFIIDKYLQIKKGGASDLKRTCIFAGKATPSDRLAKQIIHLIHLLGEVINKDPLMEDKMKIVFVPDYGLKWAEIMVPGADISEQISAPNFEISSTNSIKFAINGAISILSRCGANIELINHVGEDNVIAFGRTARELAEIKNYNPYKIIAENERLKAIFFFLDQILPRFPNGQDINPLLASIRDSDSSFVLLDFDDYIAKQQLIESLYQNRLHWLSMSLMNIAPIGWFSSDRSVKEYAENIWKVSSI